MLSHHIYTIDKIQMPSYYFQQTSIQTSSNHHIPSFLHHYYPLHLSSSPFPSFSNLLSVASNNWAIEIEFIIHTFKWSTNTNFAKVLSVVLTSSRTSILVAPSSPQPWSAIQWPTPMTFASTPRPIQVPHTEPAQLQENQPRRECQLHRGLPDYRDRTAFELGGAP